MSDWLIIRHSNRCIIALTHNEATPVLQHIITTFQNTSITNRLLLH